MDTELKGHVGGGVAGVGDGDLRALRKLLLAPEQEILRKILARLDDRATRAKEMSEALPAALLLATADAEARRLLMESLKGLVREVLEETLRERPELVERALGEEKDGPHPLQAARDWLGGVGRRLRRKVESGPPQLEQLYLVRRIDGVLVEQSLRALSVEEESTEMLAEQSRLLSLVMSFMECVRDPVMLGQYAAQRFLRVDGFVLGFHVNDRYLLLSVIRAAEECMFEEELRRCDGILEEASKVKHVKAGVRILPLIEGKADATGVAPQHLNTEIAARK